MGSAPVIGITCSTLPPAASDEHRRHSIPEVYIDCVVQAGGLPLILPNIHASHVPAYLDRIDGLVLSGGYDVDPETFGEHPHPELGIVDFTRDAFELALCHGVRARGIPTFPICRGLQILNVAYGGTLIQHIPAQVEEPICHAQRTIRRSSLGHTIDIVEGSHLHELAGTLRTRVNSYHHQAAREVGEGLVVSARAPDGVIEGLEDPSHPWLVSVQWHPERRLEDPLSQALFRGLVEAAGQVAHAGA